MTSTSVEKTFTRIAVDICAPVVRVCLRNPPVNVIDVAMMEELAFSLAEIEARADVPVVVISGSGSGFSAGVDVAAHTPDKASEMLEKFHGVIRAVVTSCKVRRAVGISRDPARMLSTGGLHSFGGAGGAEAGCGVDFYWADY
jgi:hypothetical protein